MGYPYSLSLDGRKGGQASSEDLFPLGYGERERVPLFSSVILSPKGEESHRLFPFTLFRVRVTG